MGGGATDRMRETHSEQAGGHIGQILRQRDDRHCLDIEIKGVSEVGSAAL